MQHRISRYALILLLTLFAGILPPPFRSIHIPNPVGKVEATGGMRIVYLQGKPYEMGWQQGFLFREELRQFVRQYLYEHLILEQGIAHFWLLAYARSVDQDVPDDLREEMQGIADGAGLSYLDILLLNTIPDLLALARQLPMLESFPLRLSATRYNNGKLTLTPCMSFSVWGRATIDGELLLGHHIDSSESNFLSPYLLAVVRQPAFGNAFVSIGTMGMVGVWAGMNEEKIAVALSSAPSADIAIHGQPLPFLLRRALQNAGNVDEAMNTILAAPRCTGGIILLGDGKAPDTVALELSAYRHAIFEVGAERGVLTRTNHFIDPELALLQQDTLSKGEKEMSQARLAQISTQLEFNHGWIGIEKALAFLKEDSNTISTNTQGLRVSPLYSVLFCPGKFILWVAPERKAPEFYILLNVSKALLGHDRVRH
ncbi:MAG: C45 family autoproteolytic acyltransferase/hydrolase [Anaerolineae bacterium]